MENKKNWLGGQFKPSSSLASYFEESKKGKKLLNNTVYAQKKKKMKKFLLRVSWSQVSRKDFST